VVYQLQRADDSETRDNGACCTALHELKKTKIKELEKKIMFFSEEQMKKKEKEAMKAEAERELWILLHK
jgi:hypothetical protein